MDGGNQVMYRIKPVFELKKDIEIPTNMYRMKNIHSESYQTSIQNGPKDDLEIIQKRQEIILNKLTEIKNILAALKSEVGVPKIDAVRKVTPKMCGKPNFSEFGITHDVVLNISIRKPCPPYSLLVINKIWPEVSLKYSWHLHSSALSLPPTFKQFQEQLERKNPEGESDLNIRIVWKESDLDCEFVISPIKSVPLIGEVNFLRFLNSSISSKVDAICQTITDEKLDASYCLTNCKSIDDMKPYLEILSNGLGENQWLCGDNISIVDVAAWSVFKQMKKYNLGIQTLNNWFKNCNAFLEV